MNNTNKGKINSEQMNKRSKLRKRLLSTFEVNYGALTVMVYALFSGNILHTTLIFLAAFLHELGHIFAARMLNIRISKMRLDLMGALLMTSGIHSYRSERLLCAAGPFMNLLCFLIGSSFHLYFRLPLAVSEEVLFFCRVNASLMIINTLPVRNLDGGRILHSILCERAGVRTADTVVDIFSFASICFLWMISVYLLIKYESSLSMFTFSVMLFIKLFVRGEERGAD